MGFYDPCMGEPKQLKIKYQFQRKFHEVIVDDTSPVACPLRCKVYVYYYIFYIFDALKLLITFISLL